MSGNGKGNTNGGGGPGGAKPARPGNKPASGAAKAPAKPRLAVLVDGAPLAEEDARALWVRFSQHMDAHQGDIAGFAAQEGFASVLPEHRKGQAVLVITRRPGTDS